MPVYFHSEETRFYLTNRKIYRHWVENFIKSKSKSLGELNFIFTNNDYLLKINRQYLNHNYYTDVITFDYNELELISGDIFISVDQVRENCRDMNVSFTNELCRVMIHGVLHLLGYRDGNSEERSKMRMLENEALKILKGYESGNGV